jgi:hypothetical protein
MLSSSKRQLQKTVPRYVLKVVSTMTKASLVLSISLKDAKTLLQLRQSVHSKYKLLRMLTASLLQ